MLFPYSSLSLSSLCKQKQVPALCSFSFLQFTSLHCILAKFYGSGCSDCCVNPQISFLGVQAGLVLIWLHFRDERCKTKQNKTKQNKTKKLPCCSAILAHSLVICCFILMMMMMMTIGEYGEIISQEWMSGQERRDEIKAKKNKGNENL